MGFLTLPLQLFSIGPNRSFGAIKSLGINSITGYVILSESSVDKITITKQPVQQGASIGDHAFKEPNSVSMQMLFSDNLTQNLNAIYISLLTLQSTFVPFNVITPKRTYYGMLLAAIGLTTDKKTESILAINATFEKIIIVPVTTTTVPRSQLKNAGSNGGTQSVGKKSAALILSGG